MPAESPRRSVIKPPSLARARKVEKVPFVELYAGRLQGVVSSGSDENRVYVSYFESGTTNYFCSTNHNRDCNGFRGGPCKHLQALLGEAILQYGGARVVIYLGLAVPDPEKVKGAGDSLRHIRGGMNKIEAGIVFSRFLTYLHHVNLPPTTAPVPEMNWFIR